jgi:hypothetical protein
MPFNTQKQVDHIWYAMNFASLFTVERQKPASRDNGTGKAAVIEAGERWRALWRVWVG